MGKRRVNLTDGPQPAHVTAFQRRGIRPYIVHDENAGEWVVRLKTKNTDTALCGCPGEVEAKTVVSLIRAFISCAATTFSEEVDCVPDGMVTNRVVIENVRQYRTIVNRGSETAEMLLELCK